MERLITALRYTHPKITFANGDLALWKTIFTDQPETCFTYSCDLKEITINTKYLPTEDETGYIEVKIIRAHPGISASDDSVITH